ncbi:MAG: hypothetical protein AAGA94_03235 [Pseudomonadota bacterium]
MDRILNMILRQITRRLMNKGINAGINKASAMRANKRAGDVSDQDRHAARQTKQAMKMLRRTTRM